MPVEYHFWYCVLGAAILVLMQQLTSAGQSTISGSHTYHNVKNTFAGRNNLYRSRCTSTGRSVCHGVVGV